MTIKWQCWWWWWLIWLKPTLVSCLQLCKPSPYECNPKILICLWLFSYARSSTLHPRQWVGDTEFQTSQLIYWMQAICFLKIQINQFLKMRANWFLKMWANWFFKMWANWFLKICESCGVVVWQLNFWIPPQRWPSNGYPRPLAAWRWEIE